MKRRLSIWYENICYIDLMIRMKTNDIFLYLCGFVDSFLIDWLVLSFSPDKVIVGEGEVRFGAMDDMFETTDSVWMDWLVFASDENTEGVLEVIVLVSEAGKVEANLPKKMM